MKKFGLLAAAVTAATVMAGAAQAQEAQGPEFSGTVALTSDYVFRGISQSNGGIALQGSFDMTYGSFYAGTWASSVDFNAPTNLEVDIYAGVKPTIGPFDTDFGVVGYIYPDNDSNFNYVEAYGKASHTFGEGGPTLGGALYYSPEFFGETGNAFAVEAMGAVPLGPISASASVGLQDIEAGVTATEDQYTYWNLGGSIDLAGFNIDLRYHGSDIEDGALEGTGDRGAITLKRSF
jgi:uncharacterized protein (TIGR02001 family)